jgi:hypothetical protein
MLNQVQHDVTYKNDSIILERHPVRQPTDQGLNKKYVIGSIARMRNFFRS